MKNIQNKLRILALSMVLAFSAGMASAQNIADKDIKTNVVYINNALEQIKKLEPITYQYDTHKHKYLNLESGKKYGFLTDNMQIVFPELVHNKHTSYMFGKYQYRTAQVKSIDTESLIPVLVASIKELESQVEQLKSELNQLKEAPKQ